MMSILKIKKKDKALIKEQKEHEYIKNFVDMVSPSVIKFSPSYYVFGNTYRRVFAIRNYPLNTDSKALLRKFGEKSNITLKVYCNQMSVVEYENSIESSVNKNISDTTENKFIARTKANQQLEITRNLVQYLNQNKDERMFKVSVFIEAIAYSQEELNEITNDMIIKLDGITYDNLFLRQREGFMAVNPCGKNLLGLQFERHMPSSSLANLFPYSYSGLIDKNGFFIGKDRFGGSIIVDLDKRNKTHTNSNIVILGNAGEGKSYLLKLIMVNWRMKGKKIICLDAEHEYKTMTEKLKGTFIDLMTGKYIINVLEPKMFNDSNESNYNDENSQNDFVSAFSKKTILSQHISFLRDFFKAYKEDLNDELIDVLEIELERTYKKFNIDYESDLENKKATDYPILSDLYNTIEEDFNNYDNLKFTIYTKEQLQRLLLGLYSICKGSDSRFFNGHTNIPSFDFVTFGVKSLLEASSNLKDAMLFNVLSYMTNKLLVEGNTVGMLDEFYLFLDNIVMVKYVRNFAKRVRKKDSSIVLASQNIEDYLMKDIAELTKPLFAIPTYKFLFYPGSIDRKLYTNLLNINDSEFNLIKAPCRGNCLFISGGSKYNLQVEAPEHKRILFGNAGGR
jgi:type IV secretory pathway VirB4 component